MNWENRNKFQHSLRTLLEVAHRLDERGFVAANDGNLSVRLDGNRYLATRSGSSMLRLSPLDLLVVDKNGERIDDPFHPGVPKEFRVTSEWDTHIAVYLARPDINAVVHAHPPFATSWAVARQPLPENVLPEVTVIFRDVPLLPFAVPGTPDLAKLVADASLRSSVMMLTNHGVVAIGTDPIEALDRLERIEHSAKIMLLSRLVNGPVSLSPDEVAALAAIYPS